LATITLCGQVFGRIEEHENKHDMDIADLCLHGQKHTKTILPLRGRQLLHSSWFSFTSHVLSEPQFYHVLSQNPFSFTIDHEA
jgi:hypothetical protein